MFSIQYADYVVLERRRMSGDFTSQFSNHMLKNS